MAFCLRIIACHPCLCGIAVPGVQTRIAGRLAAQLSEETGAVIDIERVAIRLLPGSVGLRNIYIEDPYGDTLVHAGRIYADIAVTALLRNRVHINSLEIENLTAFVTRTEPDTVFNFQFLADAFAGEPETMPPGPDPAEQWSPRNDNGSLMMPRRLKRIESGEENNGFSFFLDRVALHNINILFEDHFSGIRLSSRLGSLQTSLAESDLLNDKYHAGNTEIRETSVRLFTYEPSVPPEEPEEERPAPDVSLASLELTGFDFYLEDRDGGRIELTTSLLELVPEKIDLPGQIIEVGSLNAENLIASIISPPSTGGDTDAPDRMPARLQENPASGLTK
jgi:translocation and assembly module TamB